MVKGDLPFSYDTANSIMAVAKHPAISKLDNSPTLPAGMSVLIELSQLSDDDFQDAQEKGLITPDLKVKPALVRFGAGVRIECQECGAARTMTGPESRAMHPQAVGGADVSLNGRR